MRGIITPPKEGLFMNRILDWMLGPRPFQEKLTNSQSFINMQFHPYPTNSTPYSSISRIPYEFIPGIIVNEHKLLSFPKEEKPREYAEK